MNDIKICYWMSGSAGGAGKYERYLPHEIKKLGVDVITYSRPKGILGNPILLKIYYRSKGSIVHATTQTLSIYACPAPKNFVVTVHDILTLHKSIYPKIKRFLIKKFLNKADKIIAVSEFTKNEIVNYVDISEEDIYVIPMGVDISVYKPIDKIYSRKVLNLDPECKYILTVASNAPHKRMDITLKIFNRIKSCLDNVRLLKAGYGHKLCGDGIINIDFIPEYKMSYLYNASDVFIHTSEYEGFGMPILEAMACGIPVVCSRKASIPEVVGNCGYLVDLNAEDYLDQFVEKILKCIDKKKNPEGIKRAKNFSWDIIAKKTMNVYNELVSNS